MELRRGPPAASPVDIIQWVTTRPMSRAAALAALAIVLAAGTGTPGPAPAAQTAGAADRLAFLEISAEQRRRLLQGEVVPYPVDEHSDRELAVGLALLVAAPLSDLAQYLESGQLIAQDATISSFGIIGGEGKPDGLSGARFGRGEQDEAKSLLDATPGYRFNLAPPEFEAFRALRASAPPAGAVVQAVSDEYRSLLSQRWRAYQQGGLGAIAPYARGGGVVTDPANDLRMAVSDADRLRPYEPELAAALMRYPDGSMPRAINRGYWVKRQIQRRPAISLLHQMVVSGPDLVVHVERYVYVGHSYNDAQIITGAVGTEAGTVLFATSRFSTDEVLGMGNQLKRAVGRSQLRDEMRKRLEAVRASFNRPPPRETQSP